MKHNPRHHLAALVSVLLLYSALAPGALATGSGTVPEEITGMFTTAEHILIKKEAPLNVEENHNCFDIKVSFNLSKSRQQNPNYAVLGRAGRGSVIGGSAAGGSDGSAQGGGAMASPAESPAPEADSGPELEPPIVAENSAEDLS